MVFEVCDTWGTVCVSLGTNYIPIGLPSIVGAGVCFLPAVFAFQQLFKTTRERDEALAKLTEYEKKMK
eukprot:g33931.t1